METTTDRNYDILKVGLKQIPTRDLKRVLKQPNSSFLLDGDLFDPSPSMKEDHNYG